MKTPFHRRCLEVARSRWAPDVSVLSGGNAAIFFLTSRNFRLEAVQSSVESFFLSETATGNSRSEAHIFSDW